MHMHQRRKYKIRSINGKKQIGVRPYTKNEAIDIFNASCRVAQRQYETPCLEWIPGVDRKGYGTGIVYKGRRRNAHQLAWMLFRGPIPKGLFVCHHCDNRRCAKIEHLFLGDNDDNMEDAHKKGRCIGEGHWNSDLTEAQVLEMRRLRTEEGWRYVDLMKYFNLTKSGVQGIITRRTWPHLP